MSARAKRVTWSIGSSSLLILMCVWAADRRAVLFADHGDIAIRSTTPAARIPPRCDTRPFYEYADTARRREDRFAPEDLPKNEAHDCQRLIMRARDGLRHGPLAALLVSTTVISQADPAFFRPGRVVAEIVNFDGAYGPLGIQSGVSCLWLRGDGNDSTSWTARIFPLPPEQMRCHVDLAPTEANDLQVVHRAYTADVYPSTGRWMWDDRNKQQFIGILCGKAWCELGVRGSFNPSPAFTPVTVPGWSDEQLLAAPRLSPFRAVSTSTGYRVSNLIGRIEPSEQLLYLTNEHFQGDGAHVATITFKGRDEAARRAYAEKFPGECGCSHALRLYMRATDETASTAGIAPAGDDRKVYEFSTDLVKWTQVVRNIENPHAGRGAVRWAWSEGIEGTWIPCEEGCCRSDERK